jgi:hypothetical protein
MVKEGEVGLIGWGPEVFLVETRIEVEVLEATEEAVEKKDVEEIDSGRIGKIGKTFVDPLEESEG